MKIKLNLIAFFVVCLLAFPFGINLYAQEAGDIEAPAEAAAIDTAIVPNDDELAALLTSVHNPNAVVRSLVQTKWNQPSPYNNMFPLVNGQRPVTNCSITAFAQLMAFHRHPVRGSGQSTRLSPHNITVPTVNFNIAYDWANMLNSYRSDGRESNERQRNAVATLMYHVAAARGATGSSLRSLVENFGYDRSIQSHQRSFYTDSDWEALIRSQLDNGLPVYYSGGREGGGHAFIVDGYDSVGRFHINWGWSGRFDGYYSLNALTPGVRNYDRNHSIIINIRPDRGSVGSHEMALAEFSAAKNTVQQNELFLVNARIRSAGYFAGGQAGVALLDNNNTIAAIIGTTNLSARNPGSAVAREIICFINENVRAGQYRLGVVTRPENGEWKIITISAIAENVPNLLNINVTAETGAPGGGYGIVLEEYSPGRTSAAQNELFSVVLRTRNRGQEAFTGGQIGAALVDNNGNIVSVIGMVNYGSINAGSSRASNINCFVPETVGAGQYRLRIVTRLEGEVWRVNTLANSGIPNTVNFTVNQAERGVPGGGYGIVLEEFTPANASIPQNVLFTVRVVTRNRGLEVFAGGQLGAALVDNNGDIVSLVGLINYSSINVGSSRTSTINCFVPAAVRAGQYRLRIVTRPADGVWRINTLANPGIPNAVNFTVTAERGITGSGYGLALQDFTVEKVSILRPEVFSVSVRTRNVGTGTFAGGQLGVALVDNNGNIVEVVRTVNWGELNINSTRSSNISNCRVPDSVRAGQYRLMIVIRPAGGEWNITTLAVDNAPTGYNFTVR